MAVFVDTAVIWAAHWRRDTYHLRSRHDLRALATGSEGALLTSDLVYAECQALARRGGADVVLAIDDFFFGPDAMLQPVRVDRRAFEDARGRMRAHPGVPLSFADWTSLVLARRFRARRIATYDEDLARALHDPRL